MLEYEGTVIRPPSEAGSLILQVTHGCPHNRCTFCGAYKGRRFSIKREDRLFREIDSVAALAEGTRTAFLADGDALALPRHRLIAILERIRASIPGIRRVRLYGSAKSLRGKTVDDLAELKSLGLDRIYLGLESGHDPLLETVRKGVDSQAMIAAAHKTRAAGLFLSVTVLVGLAGADAALSRLHARDTARVLTAMAPNQIAALTLMLVPGTPLHRDAKEGRFRLPGPAAMLTELREMIAAIELDRVQFQANHASNYMPIDCRLLRDRDEVLARLDRAIAGEVPLMPDYLRAL